jgi:2-polyprenyl-3-methyl-5-hydroxy-6-metoxy-1,4-benzoquinol methylase
MSQPENAEVDLEVVPVCDLCGSSSGGAMFPTHDRLHRLPGTFALVRCKGCGLVRLSPRPTLDQLGLYYPDEDYLPHQFASFPEETSERAMGRVRDAVRDEVLRGLGYPTRAHRWMRPLATVARRPLRRRISFNWRGFPPYVGKGRVLDIGSGNGFFLAMLRHYGWEVRGVDMSASAAETTRREFGIDVHVGEVTDDVFEREQFDFVHMSHVIEHVPSPMVVLARVRELLRPGGLLYIETPNIASLGARLWGKYWFPLETPRHLWLFTPDTLCRALRDNGLHLDRLTTLPWTRLAWEATYMWEERHQRMRVPRPSVDLSQRPTLVASQAVTRLGRVVRPRSGDILSCWSTR